LFKKKKNVAAIFTKPLVEDKFNFIKEKLCIMKNLNKD